MSFLIMAEQASVPSTPSAGKVKIYADNTGNPVMEFLDDLGAVNKFVDNKMVLTNNSTIAVSAGYAADTYLAGSNIAIPAGRLPAAGMVYKCAFDMVKTAAGTATPILILRIGTGGTVSDTARVTFTFAAGTGAVDTGLFEVTAVFRTVGSGTNAVLVGTVNLSHALAATGLTATGTGGNALFTVVSSGFDSTVASSIIGLSFNGGASFSGTNTIVQTEAYNINI